MPETTLKEYRLAAHLTQQQLSDKSGVPIDVIQNYETGRRSINRAHAAHIIALAEVLKIHPKKLLEEDIKMITNRNGYKLDFAAAVQFMDDDIREALHNEIAPCSDQDFFTAYEAAHEAKYGTEWELSKANPVW